MEIVTAQALICLIKMNANNQKNALMALNVFFVFMFELLAGQLVELAIARIYTGKSFGEIEVKKS
jgi:hypothetical protein